MKYEETRYIITNGKECIIDLCERTTFEIKSLNDVLNLEMWNSRVDAENDIYYFKNKYLSGKLLEYFKDFHIKEIKVCIEI